MYSPTYNRLEDRAELLEFMRANSFAVLVTGLGGTLHASHLPAMVHEEGERLVIDMHMARNNPQWNEFFDEDALVIFTGRPGRRGRPPNTPPPPGGRANRALRPACP